MTGVQTCALPISRPVDADSAKTYDAIVEATLRVLERVGPEQVSMRKVASEADCSLGTLQYYFVSKSELLEACLDGYYERLSQVAPQLLSSVGDRQGRDLIEHTVTGAHAHGKPVGVCGGIAGDTQALPIVVGLGVDALSVNLPSIPAVKARIRELEFSFCRELAREALECDTAAEVRALVPSRERNIPNFAEIP